MRNHPWLRHNYAHSSRNPGIRRIRDDESERTFFIHRGLFLVAASLALWTGIFGVVKLVTLAL